MLVSGKFTVFRLSSFNFLLYEDGLVGIEMANKAEKELIGLMFWKNVAVADAASGFGIKSANVSGVVLSLVIWLASVDAKEEADCGLTGFSDCGDAGVEVATDFKGLLLMLFDLCAFEAASSCSLVIGFFLASDCNKVAVEVDADPGPSFFCLKLSRMEMDLVEPEEVDDLKEANLPSPVLAEEAEEEDAEEGVSLDSLFLFKESRIETDPTELSTAACSEFF
ncbi:hypothetical protein WICPIJ_003431 [Wickerhamomyces pijperi]|uniref:Uncharacterized protein n=1 Tax=Wickerhamomyces pijperi TaxID=599730 RepID=A0A9P8Q7Y9_WICPI|nr:hypothetical protein WICPIJ_003431 [Wickerhamomyces pijperi]